MTDIPMLFKAEMVQAIKREIERAGTGKTQTRRILKPQPMASGYYDGHLRMEQIYHPDTQDPNGYVRFSADAVGGAAVIEETIKLKCAVGDRLFVRETWSGPYAWRHTKPKDRARCGSPSALPVWYWADGNPTHGDWEKPRTSLHMPRWASRLTLIVTDVQVQRLKEISDTDAVAEGCKGHNSTCGDHDIAPWEEFHDLWKSINGAESWAENPWVAAYTFKPIMQNIDQIK